MPICPAGHHSAATDFCDTCGLPLPADAPASDAALSGPPATAPEPLAPPAALICPACGTPNVADALFCEACGHDFLGGANPPAPVPEPVEGSAPSPEPTVTPDDKASDAQANEAAGVLTRAAEAGRGADDKASDAQANEAAGVLTSTASAVGGTDLIRGLTEAPDAPATSPEPVEGTAPSASPSPQVDWIAELWIDPDWYAAQGSTDPLPSPGLPDIVPLVKESNLIGRVSTSRNIYPDIDCELDTGCSRRHARLTTDGTRWWIEDLESANGTFVGTAAGPLPAMPIPRGKVELAPDQRIYLGAWTRIVVRRATEDEKAAFAGIPS